MRFYYVALAVMTTLLASTNAITPDAEKNQVTQTTSEIVGAIETSGVVKRSLRFHDEEEDSLDSLDDSEERVGITVEDLLKLVKSKRGVIPVKMETMNESFQGKVLDILKSQNLSEKQLATKLGLKSISDEAARNYAFFTRNKGGFREGKKVKKVPEAMIGDW